MGLRRISLKDYVIVQALELDFANGFTALTGETGAGKSILIDALQLCLGARADASTIREGATRTEVWAEFDSLAPGLALDDWLDQGGFERQDSLLLRRTLDRDGKSRAWINGSPATISQLREVGDYLVDIHGQHAWAALTRSTDMRNMLDQYAQLNTAPLAQAYQAWQSAQKALQAAQTAQQDQQATREHLLWRLGELQKLAPAPEEWATLNQQHSRLANAQALLDASHLALSLLDQEDGGAIGALARAQSALQELQHKEPAFAAMADELASCLAQAQDAAHTLQAYTRRLDLDPDQLLELDARISSWMGLARRFKCPPEDLPGLLTTWSNELAALDAASNLGELALKVEQTHQHYQRQAQQISQARHIAAQQLSQAVTQAMQNLGMVGGQLVVDLQTRAQPGAGGLEDVQFLVAAHAGGAPKPVAKVASGGELSRIALALSVVTNETGNAPTVIFDEVDAGIGGAVAESVGRLMRRLGGKRQVMAVTHLAQVASYAHHHLQVSKSQQGAQTLSQIQALDPMGRETEIARMLSGEHLSEASRANAKEMLNRANAEGAPA